MRKSPQMLLLEKVRGKPIRQIVCDAINESSTDTAAAAELCISIQTLYNWRAALGIKIKREAVPA